MWREHVVVRTDEPLDGLCSVYAESSLCELLDDFIEEQHLVSRTAAQALAVVLAPHALDHRVVRRGRHCWLRALPRERSLGAAEGRRGLGRRGGARDNGGRWSH